MGVLPLLSAHTTVIVHIPLLQEFGLNTSIGPINVAALGSAASGGDELAALLGQSGDGGSMGLLVEREVKVGVALCVSNSTSLLTRVSARAYVRVCMPACVARVRAHGMCAWNAHGCVDRGLSVCASMQL